MEVAAEASSVSIDDASSFVLEEASRYVSCRMPDELRARCHARQGLEVTRASLRTRTQRSRIMVLGLEAQ